MDGTGYPFGLKGEAIPLEARIVSLADVLDAITTARPYKPAMSFEDAIQYLQKDSRHLFDPDALSALMNSINDIRDVYSSLTNQQVSLLP